MSTHNTSQENVFGDSGTSQGSYGLIKTAMPKNAARNRNQHIYLEEEVENLRKAIDEMVKNEVANSRDPNVWLQLLYQHYGSRFISDNEKIWSTGSILIPVSLAGFAAVVAVDNPSWPHVTVLMCGSIILMFIWLMIAEGHRAFQQKSEAWLIAIERTIKLEGGSPKLKRNALNQMASKVSIQIWRWLFFLLVVLGWCVVLAFTLADLL